MNVITQENMCKVTEDVLDVVARFAITNQKKQMNPILVIVPDRATLGCEKILMRNMNALLNVRVVTFSMLFHLCNVDEISVLDKTTAVLMMWRACGDVSKDLIYFSKSVHQYSFSEKMFNTINQLESSRADFLTLEKNAKSEITKRKMRDISTIHARYKELCKGYIDSAGMLGWLLDNVSRCTLIKNAHVYVTGFEYLSIQREEVLRKIASVARSFTIGAQRGSEFENFTRV